MEMQACSWNLSENFHSGFRWILHGDRAAAVGEISRLIAFLISSTLCNASLGALLMPQLRDSLWNWRLAQQSCHCNSNNLHKILEKKTESW